MVLDTEDEEEEMETIIHQEEITGEEIEIIIHQEEEITGEEVVIIMHQEEGITGEETRATSTSISTKINDKMYDVEVHE